MMEEYFVRSLGMHRVYHSAFMHMLRDGDNAGFRRIIRNMLAYSPDVLERYANFLSNPDEETAAQQFGTMDRYFTAATLQATLPGLPMLGHGQLEGSREKYGMEAARAKANESIDEGLRAHHHTIIFPLLRERERYSSTEHFHLFSHTNPSGRVNERLRIQQPCRRRTPDPRLVNHGGGHAVCPSTTAAPETRQHRAPQPVSRTIAEALDRGRRAHLLCGARAAQRQVAPVPRRRPSPRRILLRPGPLRNARLHRLRRAGRPRGLLDTLHRHLNGAAVDHLDLVHLSGLPIRPVDPAALHRRHRTRPARVPACSHPSSLADPRLAPSAGGPRSRGLAGTHRAAVLAGASLCEGGPGSRRTQSGQPCGQPLADRPDRPACRRAAHRRRAR